MRPRRRRLPLALLLSIALLLAVAVPASARAGASVGVGQRLVGAAVKYPAASPGRRNPARTRPPSTLAHPGFVQRRGNALYLDGRPYRFTGVTAFELTTYWPVNWGCGAMVDDAQLDAFFSSLRPNSMVKVTATQSMAFNNKTTGALDWSPIDRVVRAAERHGQKLIMSLATQQGDCDDGHWKGEEWYAGRYRLPFNDDGRGLSPLSYWDWMHQIVPRYRDSPAVGMWQLVVEPEASYCHYGYQGNQCYGNNWCPDTAGETLRAFFDEVGGELKRLDPNHLLNTGVIGGDHCGMVGDDYVLIHASPAVDVASFHDYSKDEEALPGQVLGRIHQMRQLGRPIIIDEVGIRARDGDPGCRSLAYRRDLFRAKMDAMFAAGISGFTPWNWQATDYGRCDLDIRSDDPTMELLRTYPL